MQRKIGADDLKPALKRYARHVEEIGLRESIRSSYVSRVGNSLSSVGQMRFKLKTSQNFERRFMIRGSLEVRSITTASSSRDITNCVGKLSTSIS